MSLIMNPKGIGRGLRIRPSVAMAVTVIFLWIVVAVAAPLFMPYDSTDFVSYDTFLSPGKQYLLGTDYMGRDLFSRILSGAGITLMTAFLATLFAHLTGSSLGMLAAVAKGLIDMVLSRVVDIVLSLPKIVVALVVIAAVGTSIPVLIVLIGVVYSATVFRIARALALDACVNDYIRAAIARGERTDWLMFGEILPNILPALAADFALRLSFAILFVSSLSFLGLGIQPPQADWGALVRENLPGLSLGHLTAIYPALAIGSVTIALNVIVDACGAFDPKKVPQV